MGLVGVMVFAGLVAGFWFWLSRTRSGFVFGLGFRGLLVAGGLLAVWELLFVILI